MPKNDPNAYKFARNQKTSGGVLKRAKRRARSLGQQGLLRGGVTGREARQLARATSKKNRPIVAQGYSSGQRVKFGRNQQVGSKLAGRTMKRAAKVGMNLGTTVTGREARVAREKRRVQKATRQFQRARSS